MHMTCVPFSVHFSGETKPKEIFMGSGMKDIATYCYVAS